MTVGKYSEGALIGIKAITPLHVGYSTDEIVDKGFIRDHLGFPTIYGSSLKGAIKKQVNIDNNKKNIIFGYEERMGAIVFLDAKLLFIPVRDIENVCSYATCPLLLKTLETYVTSLRKINEIKYNNEKKLCELIKELNSSSNSTKVLNEIKTNVVELNSIKINGVEVLKELELNGEKVYLVPDNKFKSIFEKSMIVVWRVRLKETTKKPEKGHLWSEEYLPNETILISGILYKNENINGVDIKNIVENNILNNNFLFVGGLETIGKGLIKIIKIKEKESNSNDSSDSSS